MGAKCRMSIEGDKGSDIKPILPRTKWNVCDCMPECKSRCNELLENGLGYIDLNHGIATTRIAWSQRRKKPGNFCITSRIPTHAKLGWPIQLKGYQLCCVKTIVKNVQSAIKVCSMKKDHH